MSELDEDDLKDAAESAEPGVKTKKNGVKERKLYKGEILKVGTFKDRLTGPTPVQPVTRKFKHHGFEQSLPPSFVVTKFTPSYHGFSMVIYHPATGQKIQREVPGELELNVLSGVRGNELRAEWDKAVATKFGSIARRLVCTIGTDPEVFVVDGKGALIPAWEFLPGKDKPKTFKTAAEGGLSGTAYWDGFQAEFTTHAGLSCLAQMTDCIQAGLKAVYKAAQKHNHKATLSIKSVVQVEDKVLAAAAPEHVAFGCAPSKNAYGLSGNLKEGRDVPYRFAGGHLHFGLAGYPEDKLVAIVKMMDAVLGVAAVSMFANYDNPVRRQFYGLPGEYRLPPHGLEYRTLSNAWLAHPLVTHMTVDLARAAAGLVDEGFTGIWKATEDEVVRCITEHNVDLAREILKRNESAFKGILQTIGGTYYAVSDAPALAAKCWSEGMDYFIRAPQDIVGNWKLDGAWTAHTEGANAYFGRAIDRLRAKEKV